MAAATIGDANKIIQNQNVKLLVSESAGTVSSTANQTLANIRDAFIGKSHNRNRVDHGRTKYYGHSSPDIILTFSISATSDAIGFLDTRCTLNAQNVLPTYAWNIVFTDDAGTSRTIKVAGKLEEVMPGKGRGPQGEPAEIDCRVIVTDDNITIS